MKKPEITAGKWAANQTSCGFFTVSAAIPDSNAREAVCREICGASVVEERNNATAIAALPDLLEALERAVSIIEDLPHPENIPAQDLRQALIKAGYTFD